MDEYSEPEKMRRNKYFRGRCANIECGWYTRGNCYHLNMEFLPLTECPIYKEPPFNHRVNNRGVTE